MYDRENGSCPLSLFSSRVLRIPRSTCLPCANPVDLKFVYYTMAEDNDSSGTSSAMVATDSIHADLPWSKCRALTSEQGPTYNGLSTLGLSARVVGFGRKGATCATEIIFFPSKERQPSSEAVYQHLNTVVDTDCGAKFDAPTLINLCRAFRRGEFTDEQLIATATHVLQAKCERLQSLASKDPALAKTSYVLPYFVPMTEKEVKEFRSMRSAHSNQVIDKLPRNPL